MATVSDDTAILERLIARNCLAAPRRYDGSGWCYAGTAYPDARSALAAFMAATEEPAPVTPTETTHGLRSRDDHAWMMSDGEG